MERDKRTPRRRTETLVSRLSREIGIPQRTLIDSAVERITRGQDRVRSLTKNDEGKFRVLGIDKFDGTDWVAGEFASARKAVAFAQRETKRASKSATDSSVATVYYAYTPEGIYINPLFARVRNRSRR